MASYANGSVSVGTTATLVCTVPPENDDVMVSCSAATVFGGPSVTATTGVSVPAGAPVRLPSVGGLPHTLYAVVASGTSTVTFLFPEV